MAPMVLGLAMADDGQSSQVAYDAEIHPDSDLESADLSRLQDGSNSGIPVSMIVPPCADGTCDLSLILNLTPERMSNQITFFLALGKGSSYEEDDSSIHTYITVANSQTDGWESWDTLYSADGLYIGQSLALGLAEHNYIEEGSLTINIRVWNDQSGQRGSVVLDIYEIGLERADSAFECDDGRAGAVISIGGWPAQHGQGVNLTSTDGTSVFYQGVSGVSDFGMNQFSLAGEEEDIAFELQQAIEHPSGHGGSILVSRTLGVLNLTQALPGSAGNTQVISDMPSVWQDGTSSNYFTGGCTDENGDGVDDWLDPSDEDGASQNIQLGSSLSLEIISGSNNNDTVSASFASVRFSPDGLLLARAGHNLVEVFETENWTKIQTLTTGFSNYYPYQVQDIEFSPDGSILAAADWVGKSVLIWNTTTWALERTVNSGQCEYCKALEFSPDGSLLVSGGFGTGDYEGIRIWDTSTWDMVGSIGDHACCDEDGGGVANWQPYVYSLAFSHDGQILATGHAGALVLYDRDWPHTITHVTAISGYVKDIEFFPPEASHSFGDQYTFVAAVESGGSSTLRTYHIRPEGMQYLPSLERMPRFPDISLSPDGSLLAIGGTWSEDFGATPEGETYGKLAFVSRSIGLRHDLTEQEWISGIDWSPDGSLLATSILGWPWGETRNGALGIWYWDSDADGVADDSDQCPDTPTGDTLLDISGHEGCSWGQLDYDNDGVENSQDIDIFDPALSHTPEAGAGFLEWRSAEVWQSGYPTDASGWPSVIDVDLDGDLEIYFQPISNEFDMIEISSGTNFLSETQGLVCSRGSVGFEWTCPDGIHNPVSYWNTHVPISVDLDLDGDNELQILNDLYWDVGEGQWYFEDITGMGVTPNNPQPQTLWHSTYGCTTNNGGTSIIAIDFDRDGKIEFLCGNFVVYAEPHVEGAPNIYVQGLRQIIGFEGNYCEQDAAARSNWAYEPNSGRHLLSCQLDSTGPSGNHVVSWFDNYSLVGSRVFEKLSSLNRGVGGLGDVNGDGWIDHIFSNATVGSSIQECKVYLGDGTGFSENGVSLGNFLCSHNVRLIDLDGDGDLDISADDSFVFNEDGTFVGVFGQAPAFLSMHTLADVDGDGDLDRITNYVGEGSQRGINIFYNPWFPDEDGDGVADSADLCPYTGGTETADSNGCSPEQFDSDEDGVMDSIDACPETLSGDSVDQNGCSAANRDSDQDGMVDSIDQCPDTPPGSAIDLIGCAVGDVVDPDSDGDGVRDSADSCPGTAGGSVVDSQGCAVGQSEPDQGGDVTGESSDSGGFSTFQQGLLSCFLIIVVLAIIGFLSEQADSGKALPTGVMSAQEEYEHASRLQETLGSTMQENDGLRREREQLTRLLRSSDLTETENRTLRNELSTMQSVMGENDEMAREMVAELEELRGALAEERAAAKEASAEYRDSVHQGDNVGQKVESQTINDADAIARIALESYKQALKDMGKED